MITTEKDKCGGTIIKVNNHLIAVVTEATNKTALEKFIQLCQFHEQDLDALGKEYDRCVELNRLANGNGKNYPIFNKRTKFIDRLADKAGIVDS